MQSSIYTAVKIDSVTLTDSQALESASFVNGVLLWTEVGISETKILSLC